MEKKILIPTNFSKYAWNALVYALNLYRKVPCTIYILHSFQTSLLEDAVPMSKKFTGFRKAKLEADEGLNKILQGLNFRKENPKHRFETISAHGKLVEEMQHVIDKKGIDLVIAGSQGENVGINSAYSSNIVQIVAEIEQCPVLVIPEKLQLIPENVREIVLPTNFRYPFKLKELSALTDLAENFRVPVRILYVDTENKKLSEEQEINKTALEACFTSVEASFHKLTHPSLTTGINLFLQSRESGILALYKRKQGFFTRLFSQPFVDEIDFDPNIPVLILKEFS